MLKRTTTINIAFLLALFALALGGCGDGNDTDISFQTCGNGAIDSGETCDDGNTSDGDGCLSTCVPASCGDGFVNVGTEACDGSNLAGASCTSLGLGSGALRCSSSCTFDTTGCGSGATATPVTVATPTPDGAATATPGDGGETPTPAPTSTASGGPTCSSGDTITVALSIDAGGSMLSGVNANISYPSSANLAGSINEQSVKDRVTFVPTGGLSEVNDEDTNSDLVDDRLTLSFASTSAFAEGPFASVEFDCLPGSPAPASGAFTCAVVSASDDVSNTISATCALTVTGP
jgi:cysteine-rich repeat protein